MDFFDWISPNLYWLFDDKPPPRSSSGFMPLRWTKEEDGLIRKYYPNFSMLSLVLPHRSHNARKLRACKLGVSKAAARWSEVEIGWLKAKYPSASWAEIHRNIPNRSKGAILNRTCALRLRRQRKMIDLCGLRLLEDISGKAKELNFTLADLDEEAGIPGYFTNFSSANYALLEGLNKAISAMGGELQIRWYGQ
ncbi:hypothetical protein [Methylobacterium sp. WL6]|uniref:hypothetical protein n=1 Tax=Methylobacterium sp. WL6 TaxID=2603901 RepID=UPI0011CAB912|nr:hypothetical protein [Methylobacterium sp. WL6]TXN71741.1 hypothetical protein FV230_07410 [Methylobacterium sp. WL6]